MLLAPAGLPAVAKFLDRSAPFGCKNTSPKPGKTKTTRCAIWGINWDSTLRSRSPKTIKTKELEAILSKKSSTRYGCLWAWRLLHSGRGIEGLDHQLQRLRHHEHERVERNPGDHIARYR